MFENALLKTFEFEKHDKNLIRSIRLYFGESAIYDHTEEIMRQRWQVEKKAMRIHVGKGNYCDHYYCVPKKSRDMIIITNVHTHGACAQ